MTPPIAVIDYGAGNLTSVRKGLAAAGADVFVPTDRPRTLPAQPAIVVPGVGHFAATAALDGALARRDSRRRRSLVVRCSASASGMQWLFEGSDEAPEVPGSALFEVVVPARRDG